MSRRERWIMGAAIAVSMAFMNVAEARNDGAREWRSAPDLLQSGELPLPGSILEVQLRFDADVVPTLALKHLVVKEGYAPTPDPLQHGHTLTLLNAGGDILQSLIFDIPIVVADPPPLSGQRADGNHLARRQVDFALTVPFSDGAVTLRISDPQGLVILEASLTSVSHEPGHPSFQSQRAPQHSSLRSSALQRVAMAWEWLVPSAEAATDGALDITFVGDNYAAADLAIFQADVDRVIGHLLSYEPFASRAGQILFHRVDNVTVDLGCVHDATMNRLIVCNNTTVTSVVNSAGAPYDKIIVLVNDPTYGGSGGSIAVAYNGSYGPQVAVHEFGHSFGNLLDEYLLYSTNGALDNSTHANCFAGTPPDSSWNGLVDLASYALGCDYPNWQRPSPCSLMLDLSCTYFNSPSQKQLNAQLDYFAGSLSPSVTLTASPVMIGAGGSATLTWSSANVSSCAASDGWSGTRPISGSETVSPSVTTTFTLTCTGTAGTANQSVTVTVDNQLPAVSLTSPVDGSVVTGTVMLSAIASDNQGIGRVDFLLDGILLGSDSTPSFGISWNTANAPVGAHVLTARATDQAGNQHISAPVNVTVNATVTTTHGKGKKNQ